MDHSSDFNRNENSQFGQFLSPQDEPQPSHEEKEPKLRIWVYFAIALCLLASALYLSGFLEERDPALEVIHAQLELFKSGKIAQAYYDETASEFQKTTSLESFRSFILQHPLFITYQKAEFASAGRFNSSGELEVAGVLRDANGNQTGVEYTLLKEGDTWKIWNIHLSEDRYSDHGLMAQGQGEKEEKDPAFQPIEKQLRALKNGNIPQSYQGLMASEFEQSTPYSVFKQFVDRYPVLRNYHEFDVVSRKVDADHAEIRVLVQAANQSLSLQYSLLKENKQWKIWAIKVIQPKPETKLAREEDILVPIQEQIAAIREKDFPKAYYETVSKSFQATSSFADFQKFVVQYPQLKQGKVRIKDKGADEKRGFVVADFVTPANTLKLKYLLDPEGEEWKILGMEILGVEDNAPKETPYANNQRTQKADLIAVKDHEPEDHSLLVEEKLKIAIREALSLLRQEDWHTAYRDYTTKDFKESTNSESFYKFISHYTIFKQVKTVTFDHLTFENNVGLYHVTLVGLDGSRAEVQFDLTKEEGQWKVQQIQVFSYIQASKSAPIAVAESTATSYTAKPSKVDTLKADVLGYQIVKMEIGDAVDGKGTILFPSNDMQIGAQKLYVNVSIRNGSRGEPVELLLAHLPTQSKAPTLRSNLTQNGDSMLSFVFTPPQNGWPKGEYVLQALDATGKIKREEHFVVRS